MEFERLLKRDMGIASVVTVALSLCITSFSNADELANPQIIGGKISPAGSYPWLGALVDAEEEDLSRAQFCGCSLIDENWILTAAHCLYGEDSSKVAVAFGDGDLSKENRVIPIDLIILHPDYLDVLGFENDIALARLAEPVLDISPIPLNRDPALIDTDSPVRVIGWGLISPINDQIEFTELLKEADLSVLDRDILNSLEPVNDRISPSMLPVGKLEPLTTSYFGDSGGPMLSLQDETRYLLGVTSWGFGCFVSFLPYSVYTDVMPHLDWIDSIVDRDRVDWEHAYAHLLDLEESLPREIAYRLGISPLEEPTIRVNQSGIETHLFARPFSNDWKYELSYLSEEESNWRELPIPFDQKIEPDGSLAASLPQDVDTENILIRSMQTKREKSGPIRASVSQGQTLSGTFEVGDSSVGSRLRVFELSTTQTRDDHLLSVRISEGGGADYSIISTGNERRVVQKGDFFGSLDLEFESQPGERTSLFLQAKTDLRDYTVSLDVDYVSGLQAGGDFATNSLSSSDYRIAQNGHAMDLHRMTGNNNPNDVLVVLDASFDSALVLWDRNTLREAGQSDNWGADSPEFFIFNRLVTENVELKNFDLKVLNAVPNQQGSYRIDVFDHPENDQLSLTDEFDFRAITAPDYTSETYQGLNYVDRVNLVGLGSGTRYLSVVGLSGFRPAFGLMNTTDNLIVQEFDSAACFESSVIEFTHTPGNSYQAIIAGSSRSLNKNYFLEISATPPESPYDDLEANTHSNSSKIRQWFEKRYGKQEF